ncbi:MAG: Ig-like domain-containing protein, partial [Verrucomicrobiota bacterium]
FQSFFRAAGGNTIASIGLDPDYNLAVAPASATNSGQSGKFVVSVTSKGTSNLPVTYQVSGSASNGVDYTSLGGTVTITNGQLSAEIEITPLFDSLAGLDESVTLTLVLGNGYLVNPSSASATMKIYPPRPSGMAVAIHDSGWTKTNGLSSTNWNYFVMPESVKEALRSDGTPYVVLSDLDIATGVLLNSDGTPKYPILISLAAEAIRDEEIAALANYVSNGGFVLAGSSSFTRNTDGSFRGDFALTNQMGLSCSSPSAANWSDNYTLTLQTDHRLVQDIPSGTLVWRMPTSADEISWGTCLTHSLDCNGTGFNGPHQIWQVQVPTNSGVQVLAWGDTYPYLTVNPYGSGQFIYDAALQPLIGHGGFAPGMYAYMIFRRAIEWAFQNAQLPVVRLSPWPYQYDAAFMIRHDLEDYSDEIAHVADSAYIEYTNGAYGDYYFCTSQITNDPTIDFSTVVSGLQTAVSNYGATIGPHNGGMENPRATGDPSSCCDMDPTTYEYWHWGPDEALDLPGGKNYASNSLAIAFGQVESWVTNQVASPRVWCPPYFNATREDSYEIEEGLSVKITGDQKLTPFPSFTLSTRTDGKRYAFLSEPVSDWFTAYEGYDYELVAQSMDPWHPPGVHTANTLHAGANFYYTNGFLLNFYAHGLTTGLRAYPFTAGYLIPDYVQYCMNTQSFPRLWSTNARGVYAWWVKRSTAQITASYGTTNGTHSLATVTISGAQDTNTAVEILASGFGSAVVSRLLTNGETNNTYRTSGELIKVLVGTTVTNVQVEYFPGPFARDDFYIVNQTQSLATVAATGVLSNDWSGTWPGLTAITNSVPLYGSLLWDANNDGGFTYTPATDGTECFTYQATDGTYNFGSATVTILVTKQGTLYSDDFQRCSGNSLAPWQVYAGGWSMSGGVMQGSQGGNYANSYLSPLWTDSNYSVEGQVQLADGTYGGGLGACLTASTGAHYAAWLYPGANVLKLVKFYTWTTWGNDGTDNHQAMAETNLPSIGPDWHPLKLVCSNGALQVYYHGTNVISVSDPISPVYSTGGVSLDIYDGGISVSNLVVVPVP